MIDSLPSQRSFVIKLGALRRHRSLYTDFKREPVRNTRNLSTNQNAVGGNPTPPLGSGSDSAPRIWIQLRPLDLMYCIEVLLTERSRLWSELCGLPERSGLWSELCGLTERSGLWSGLCGLTERSGLWSGLLALFHCMVRYGSARLGTVRYGSVRVGLHFHRSLVPL